MKIKVVSAPKTPHDGALSLIHADLLIPGRGDPLDDAALVIHKDKIEWVGPQSDVPDKYTDLHPTCVPVLMPGLWDCHVHFTGSSWDGELAKFSPYLPSFNVLAGALSAADLKNTLMAGFTSVRDLSGFGCDLWPGVAKGFLVGPNIYGSVAALSITGGHGDDGNQPLQNVISASNLAGAPIQVCDGVEGCTRAVRTVIRRGARVIKVCSSGGVMSVGDDPEDRQFSDEELRAIVDEAGRSRRAVAAHAIGKAGILAALRAGATSIEHGIFLDDEVADMMLEKDVTLVPTQHVIRSLVSTYLGVLDPAARDNVLKISEQSKSGYKLALKRGIRFALGTDTLSSDTSSPLRHGNNAQELGYAVELGMTPLQAIEMATANGPATLGGMAPLSGQLKEGYDADLIAVCQSPLDDVKVLTHGDNVTHVWKSGELFKCPA
ncbi:amidohydrolase family protein [Sarocladium implicatum]|nr:amidohydrolase family protein [Sarocladium implicatum]